MPANVTAAVVSQHGGFQRQEEILARHEHILAVYEAKTTGAQGGKQFGVPNLFVGGNAVVGCPTIDVPASVADGTADRQKLHTMKTNSKEAPAEPAAVAPGPEASIPRGDGQSQDTSLQPDINNSQLQFLHCLQSSQEFPMGPSQENLFPWSQPTMGASDPLLGTPLSQGPWGAHASDPMAGPTTSQLLASQPVAPAAGENEGGQ